MAYLSAKRWNLHTVFPVVTVFIASFLLFWIEPLAGKKILPWFGGSAAVWSVCLVFYQVALLLGYLYSRILTRHIGLQKQLLIHLILLIASLTLLPIGPNAAWKSNSSANPTWLILDMLAMTLGLPFILLSATSPLLQNWLSRSGYPAPYRLFALSNFASLAALLSYPSLLEPKFDTRIQSLAWSSAYAIFVCLCSISGWLTARRRILSQNETTPPEQRSNKLAPLFWFLLPACGSMLLLSVTNHISENVAAIPLLWVLPLAVYLLTFIVAFNGKHFYKRGLWMRFLAVALGIIAYSLYNLRSVENVIVTLVIFLFGLFVACTFLHSELYRMRPAAGDLTSFYLFLSFGGATGAIFIGLAAPTIFDGIYELPITLIVTAALALLCIWSENNWGVRTFWIAVTCSMVIVLGAYIRSFQKNAIYLNRSFYGSLRVVQSTHAGEDENRELLHGTIEHGAQFLLPPRRFQPTTYYGPDSGVGVVLGHQFTQEFQLAAPKRVGVIGIGVGTVAAYGAAGDVYRFYEINPQVITVSQSLFTYLRETKAKVQIVEGDARLSLQRDSSIQFDVLVVDAFSGDAIPVHLLTREAFALYLRHLEPAHGVIAVHVSNRYLDLAPVVRQLAEQMGRSATLLRNSKDDDELIFSADWVLITRDKEFTNNPEIKTHVIEIPSRAGQRPWTDAYNDLFEVLKTPHAHQEP